jgi:hypothetical protein
MKPRAEQLLDIYRTKLGQRANFESYWQSLHDYFYIESGDVDNQSAPGSELNVDALYDSTTLDSGDVLASGFMNYLTPPSSKWFNLVARNKNYRNNKGVTDYFENVADEVNLALNRSNFYGKVHSSYKGSGIYGTSLLLEEDDANEDIRFYNVPVKNACLIEDGRGRVSSYFFEFEYTANQAYDKWGDSISSALKEEIAQNKGDSKKHCFILYISERFQRDVNKSDRKNKPIEGSWIDEEAKSIVYEGGYNELPAMCHRFDKRPFIEWGYSPAMKALPFARILNAIAKTNLRAMMKHTDPPIALPSNAFLLPFNSNPRATNYYNRESMPNGQKDIITFGNDGNPDIGLKAIEYYQNQVKKLMYNDVFLAFDGVTKQMNNPEVMEKINEKMTMLGPAVGRYISEVITPIVVRTIGILQRKGRLPNPPEELLQDPGYEIDCNSQLAMAQRRSELNSLMSGISLVGQIAQFKPEVLDKISGDKVVAEAWNILGAPTRVFNDDAEIEATRANRANQAQMAQQMQMANVGADVIKKGSEVDRNLAQTQGAK